MSYAHLYPWLWLLWATGICGRYLIYVLLLIDLHQVTRRYQDGDSVWQESKAGSR
jgi:hypothetical protein